MPMTTPIASKWLEMVEQIAALEELIQENERCKDFDSAPLINDLELLLMEKKGVLKRLNV